MTLFSFETTASFSPDRRYRYDLVRRWEQGPLALFIMLNPSTADETADDPTIRRCIGFAKREHCGGLVVCNLYALRATHPDSLPLNDAARTGPENEATLKRWMADPEVGALICAWGVWPLVNRLWHIDVEALAESAGRTLCCLGRTKQGAPRHPLYVHRAKLLEAWP